MRRLGSLLLVASLGFAVLSCSSDADSDEDRPVTLTIGDAKISLDLMGQTTSEAATITALDAPEGAIAAFELLPNGATFEEPVTLSITLPGEPTAGLLAAHRSDETDAELLSFRPVGYAPASDSTRYEASVTHFSRFIVTEGQRALAVSLQPEPDRTTYAVGESFTIRVRTAVEAMQSIDYAVDDDGEQVRVRAFRDGGELLLAQWQSAGAAALPADFGDALSWLFMVFPSEEFDPSPLSPASIAQTSRQTTPGTTLEDAATFTCARPGRFFVWFEANAQQSAELSVFQGAKVTQSSPAILGSWGSVTVAGECVGAASTPSATPTPGSFTDPSTPSATAITTGPAAPTVVLPPAPASPSPYVIGEWHEAPLILAYAHDGAWYDGHNLSVTAAHEPFCTYEHLHGGPIDILVPVDGKPAQLTEMYGECGYGPSSALYWIEDPRTR